MPKAFSLASWNVEHFRGDPERTDRVLSFLEAQSPDIFALYEIEGSNAFAGLVERMPGYTFHITEGRQTQEILVGLRSGLTGFFTQRLEFKSGSSYLRPGALLTVVVDGASYPILFLHTKSGDDPKGLGLRDDMLTRAIDFRKALDRAFDAEAGANYLFLGDLNVMGMRYTYARDRDIPAQTELHKLERKAARRDLRRLSKSAQATWSGGSTSSYPDSDLDQVIAAEHLRFKSFGGADVDVRGWTEEESAADRDRWIREHSDHALLYLEVQKV